MEFDDLGLKTWKFKKTQKPRILKKKSLKNHEI